MTDEPAGAVAASADGTVLVSAHGQRHEELQTRRLPDGRLTSKRASVRGRVSQVAVSRDGTWFASRHDMNPYVLIWHAGLGHPRFELAHGSGEHGFGPVGQVNAIAMSPDDTWLATAGDDGQMRIWRLSDGHEMYAFDIGWRDSTWGHMAVGPDGSWLATTGYDTVHLWRTRDGSKTLVIQAHKAAIHRLAISPDGSWLASTSADGTLCRWRTSDGHQLATLECHPSKLSLRQVGISSDGAWLASACMNEVWLWDVETSPARVTAMHLDGDIWASCWLPGSPARLCLAGAFGLHVLDVVQASGGG